MPKQKCTANGKPGTKYGQSGKCYTGADQDAKAGKQAAAMYASGYKGGGSDLARAVRSHKR